MQYDVCVEQTWRVRSAQLISTATSRTAATGRARQVARLELVVEILSLSTVCVVRYEKRER